MDLSTSKAQLIGVSIFALIFVSAGIAKHGLLLAYLNASGYLAFLLTIYITIKVVEWFDIYLRQLSDSRYGTARKLRFLRPILAVGSLLASVYLLFFIQPDKLAIAYAKGIPIEALYPCSNQPLDPEVERIAREIFRLREIEKFDERYCNSEG